MAEFMKSLRFREEELSEAYESRYCRHFYTAEEIARFRAKWSS